MGRKFVSYLSGTPVLVFVLSGLVACSGGGGGNGVMTPLARWAFAREDNARGFVAHYGDEISSFEQAIKIASLEIMDRAAEKQAIEKERLRAK